MSRTLIDASQRIKLLNDELHAPGGPLAGSDLELIGFDSKGRLLLVHRNKKSGQVEGKLLVDSQTGTVVARTRRDNLDIWEKSTAYEPSAQGQDGPLQQYVDGATIWLDNRGDIRKVRRANGDVIRIGANTTEDANRHLMAVRMGGKCWSLRKDGEYPHAELLLSGALQVTENGESRWCALPNGASVDYRHIAGHWHAVQMMDAYGNLRIINRNEHGTPIEITLLNVGSESETYKMKDTAPGVSSFDSFWVKLPEDPGKAVARYQFDIEADGSLKQFTKSNEYIEYKSDGSLVSTAADGKQTTLRPAYHRRDQHQF